MHSPAVTPQLFMTASRCFGCESRQLYTIFSDLASAFTDFIVFLQEFLHFIWKKSNTSSAFVTIPAPCAISRLQPSLSGSMRRPGSANTSFPCSSARSAVIREPLLFRAYTTSTRSDSPLMIRFRIGKWDAVGGTPGPYSDNMPPCSRMRACSRMPDGG